MVCLHDFSEAFPPEKQQVRVQYESMKRCAGLDPSDPSVLGSTKIYGAMFEINVDEVGKKSVQLRATLHPLGCADRVRIPGYTPIRISVILGPIQTKLQKHKSIEERVLRPSARKVWSLFGTCIN